MTADAIAVGQFMISRPIFCGPVVGLFLGDIIAGLYIGMIMELLWVAVVPLGNAVPPDSTVVTIGATYVAAVNGCEPANGYMLFLILCFVPAGVLYKKIDIIHRSLNSYFIPKLDMKISEGDVSFIDKTVYLSALLFVLKASVFLLLLMILGEKIIPPVFMSLGSNLQNAMSKALFFVPALGLGVAINTFLFKKSQLKR